MTQVLRFLRFFPVFFLLLGFSQETVLSGKSCKETKHIQNFSLEMGAESPDEPHPRTNASQTIFTSQGNYVELFRSKDLSHDGLIFHKANGDEITRLALDGLADIHKIDDHSFIMHTNDDDKVFDYNGAVLGSFPSAYWGTTNGTTAFTYSADTVYAVNAKWNTPVTFSLPTGEHIERIIPSDKTHTAVIAWGGHDATDAYEKIYVMDANAKVARSFRTDSAVNFYQGDFSEDVVALPNESGFLVKTTGQKGVYHPGGWSFLDREKKPAVVLFNSDGALQKTFFIRGLPESTLSLKDGRIVVKVNGLLEKDPKDYLLVIDPKTGTSKDVAVAEGFMPSLFVTSAGVIFSQDMTKKLRVHNSDGKELVTVDLEEKASDDRVIDHEIGSYYERPDGSVWALDTPVQGASEFDWAKETLHPRNRLITFSKDLTSSEIKQEMNIGNKIKFHAFSDGDTVAWGLRGMVLFGSDATSKAEFKTSNTIWSAAPVGKNLMGAFVENRSTSKLSFQIFDKDTLTPLDELALPHAFQGVDLDVSMSDASTVLLMDRRTKKTLEIKIKPGSPAQKSIDTEVPCPATEGDKIQHGADNKTDAK